ncbi:hypothetical protein BC835DRAFT_1310434 [Cytidiella melzeri]|nr:hypothetical protein BC835DRAFT_1310434 [Cytidiella melzeri]
MALDSGSIVQHPNIWFEDGNVVLVAKRVQDSASTAPANGEMLQDCPVIRLADDNPDEVAAFYKEHLQVPLTTIAAALRVGTKYAFDAIREEALRRISVCYPKDLAYLHVCKPDDEDTACSASWGNTDCIAIFHLARQLGLDDIIPAALYNRSRGGGLHILSLSELKDCMQAREDLLLDNLRFYNNILNTDPSPTMLGHRDRLTYVKPVSRIFKKTIARNAKLSGRSYERVTALCFQAETATTTQCLINPWYQNAQDCVVLLNRALSARSLLIESKLTDRSQSPETEEDIAPGDKEWTTVRHTVKKEQWKMTCGEAGVSTTMTARISVQKTSKQKEKHCCTTRIKTERYEQVLAERQLWGQREERDVGNG